MEQVYRTHGAGFSDYEQAALDTAMSAIEHKVTFYIARILETRATLHAYEQPM